MKKILLMFLIGTMTMFSQTTKVRGVTLTYDKVKKNMILSIPEKTMVVEDRDTEVRITIDKEFSLKMMINGLPVSVSNEYFLHEGRVIDGLWTFFTIKTTECKEIKMNYIYQFPNVKPGEYILTVSDVCDGKWETNEKNMSIIVN
jgi:hypothetical protein